MVPAPMLTRAPTCASPTYARWFAFEPAPSSEFFTSTKLPMCTPPEREALGRNRANGPMLQLGPMRAPAITQWGKTSVSAPISLSRITQPAPTRTRSPSATFPSSTTFTSMNTSLPWVTLPRRAHQDSGVAVADPPLRLGRILLLRDALHTTAAVADDAAIAFRVVRLHRKESEPPPVREREKLREVRAADERHVPVEHQDPLLIGNVLDR